MTPRSPGSGQRSRQQAALEDGGDVRLLLVEPGVVQGERAAVREAFGGPAGGLIEGLRGAHDPEGEGPEH